jgi:hypothetical protein
MLMPGINVRKPALELADEEWQRVIDFNPTARPLRSLATSRTALLGSCA